MNEAARLRWQCRRGVRELDFLLAHYLNKHYADAGVEEQRQFQALLMLEDSELLSYLFGDDEPGDADQARLIEKISFRGTLRKL